MRRADKRYYNQLSRIIGAVFNKKMRRSKNTLCKVWAIRSDQDHCLQAVDLISNFCYRYRRFNINQPPSKGRDILSKMPEAGKWFDLYQILEAKIKWLQIDRFKRAGS